MRDPDAAIATLSGGQRQSVAICRAAMWATRVVLMDEPTAALGVVQTERTLNLIRRIRDTGIAVVLISHNMRDVLEVAGPDRGAAPRPADCKFPQPRPCRAGSRRRDDRSTRWRCRGGGVSRPLAAKHPEPPPATLATGLISNGRWRRAFSSSPAWMGAILFGLVVIFSLLRPTTFPTALNLRNVFLDASSLLVVSVGMTYVMIAGGFDLSIGSVLVFSGVIGAEVMGGSGQAWAPFLSAAWPHSRAASPGAR